MKTEKERIPRQRETISEPQYVLSLSYGKDSLACLGAIAELGWPLHRIVHCEIWATREINADLPPMIQFKDRADEIIYQMTGITVERVRAKKTYEEQFYTKYKKPGGVRYGQIYGWPMICHGPKLGAWCNSKLKVGPLKSALKNHGRKCTVQYIGIAADEPSRFHNLSETKKSPLTAAGWTETMCREWCESHGLLSPIYQSSARGGCWFCHNQSVQQLRLLRREYPAYWALLLKWDRDSGRSFKADGHTALDFERRFAAEDAGVFLDRPFRWKTLEDKSVAERLRLIQAAGESECNRGMETQFCGSIAG